VSAGARAARLDGTATGARTARYLVVNADDYGRSSGVNRGVERAHLDGIVTSASLMVRWPAAAAAAVFARAHVELGLGLHLDLGEWRLRNGEWSALYEVCPLEDAAAVAAEAMRQLERFRELAGCDPAHLDSHQHVHRREPVSGVVERIARELGVPLRGATRNLRYCGDFYGQDECGRSRVEAISEQALIAILRRLPAGVTELCCHPAAEVDLDTMYTTERVTECASLCSDQVRAVLASEGIVLCSSARISELLAGAA
jgi:predicted glycoside hydrolase/deacetylase ChbG (UPF0249 family)